MFAFMSSWLTPTSLFLILNLMIGTIFIISRFTSHKTSQHHQLGPDNSYQLVRVPSLLDRVKSINFSLYKFPSSNFDTNNFLQHTETEPYTNRVEPPPLARAPSFLERVKSINFSSFYSSDPPNPQPEVHTESDSDSDSDPSQFLDHHVKRSKSETKPGPERVPEKMKKSASEKSGMGKSEVEEVEEVERRRPEMVRVEKTVSFGEGGDHGVDAKADDFINRFKQQLKLQRLDSLLRYRDMMRRGK